MTDERPSPEKMLARAAEEARLRGRLKVFFGMAPGVGKTCAMLEAGGARFRDGADVILGWIETHGRPETEALAEGLPRLVPKEVDHRGVLLREFDLAAALERHPQLLLLDELPHTNAPGSAHPKRWQDVRDLLDAGIDVYTTLNVQHLESMHDVVAQITGVDVRETVPDALFDGAEIELVDLAPDDLLERLREGKVYQGEAAGRAAANFFAKGNLIALRELALRKSTERVDAQVEAWREQHGMAASAAGERLMVAVGPAPQSRDLVRATYRMATRLRAKWLAVTVENLATDQQPTEVREATRATMRLAEQLGGEPVVVRGESVADALVELARARGITRILLGRPTHPRWVDRIRGSLVDALIRQADGIDVLVTTGETKERAPVVVADQPAVRVREYIEALGWVTGASAVGVALRSYLDLPDFAMLELLGVVIAASRVGSYPSLMAAVASVAAFDVLFVEPRGTFRITDLRYLLTFGVMLGVGIIVSRLTVRNREQAESAARRERRTAALYELSRDLAQQQDPRAIATSAVDIVNEYTARRASVAVLRAGRAEVVAGEPLDEHEGAIARWVLDHGRAAGAGTDTLTSGRCWHLPLPGASAAVAVLAIDAKEPLPGDTRDLVEAFARQVGIALERASLTVAAESARVAVETERLRNELLSAVSHDLRTPLSTITGAAEALRGSDIPDDAKSLAADIQSEGEHLSRLVADLLDLTRLESGTVRVKRELVPVEEVVDAARTRLGSRLDEHPLHIDVPDEVLQAPLDPVLITQVLVNLIENAAKYSPRGVAIDVRVRRERDVVRFEVLDRGPGVADEHRERIFEKFFRAGDGGRVAGTGLGLAICRAVVKAHGGRIVASARDGGGARFMFEIPVEVA